MHLAELPAAAGLLFVAIASLGLALDRLAIRNLGLFGVDFDLVALLSRSRTTIRCNSLIPVITSSLVCGSRSILKVGSSSTTLCKEPESFASSPRLLGVAAKPTIASDISAAVS